MADQIVIEILSVIPDACPRWIHGQVQLQMAVDPTPFNVQTRILDSAFTVGYVKATPPPMPVPPPPPAVPPAPVPVPAAHAAGKRKAPDQEPANVHANKKQVVSARVDYTRPHEAPSHARDFWYRELSVKYLSAQFPSLPVHYLRRHFQIINHLVPTYLTLRQELLAGTTCPLLKKRRFCTGPYGRECDSSPAFAAEKKALDAFIGSGHTNMNLLRSASPAPDATVAVAQRPVASTSQPKRPVAPPVPVTPPRRATPPRPVETTELECGCCFADTEIAEMMQCAEGHLFCATCTKQNAETAVGDRNPNILCMDQSGCRAPFPDDQLQRVLSSKTIDLIDRLRQKKELEDANIGGLEHCPFCDFACIIVDDGRTFLCQKATCGAVSCRKCWKKDHAPKTCEEAEQEEKSAKGEHAVAEAMTKALIRDCPKCKTPFMKEAGQPDAYHKAAARGRCRLWDIDRVGRTGGSPTRTHAEDVARAEREARARLAASGSGRKG